MSTLATPTDRDDVHRPGAAPRSPRRYAAVRPWRAWMGLTGAPRLDLGSVRSFEVACVVPDDPGAVVRGAQPISSDDRDRMREQHIARLLADYRRQH